MAEDDQDDFDNADPINMEGLAQGNRKTAELDAAMQARLKGTPKFPYPPELEPHLKHYWLELVNSFPKDHFQISDISLMRMYCRCAYDIDRTTLMIAEEGEVVVGARGNPMVNPRVKVRSDAQSTMMGLATKFRNQPASRTNTENHQNRQGKATAAGAAAEAIGEEADGDGLLAGSRMH
jgi:phage terminase small subunit